MHLRKHVSRDMRSYIPCIKIKNYSFQMYLGTYERIHIHCLDGVQVICKVFDSRCIRCLSNIKQNLSDQVRGRNDGNFI